MITLFYGNDTLAVRQAAFDYIAPFEKRGVTVALIDADSYTPGVLSDAAGASSLFGEETLYVLDTPSSSKDFQSECETALGAVAESTNQFVVMEGALLAAQKKIWQKHVSELTEYKASAGERFNTFALADALARKDKKSLWVLLQEAKAAGQSAEEIIGVLWWQLKSLRLAACTGSAEEAGMKSFPYNKAKRALSKFKDGELATLSLSLLTLYHDGHAGVVEIDEALEQWILQL